MIERATPSAGGDRGAETPPHARTDPSPGRESREPEVLAIMADIESQFDRLRTVRKEQIDAIRDLSARTTKVEAQEQQLIATREALEADREIWETQRRRDAETIAEGRRGLEADAAAHDRRQQNDRDSLLRDRESLEEDRRRHREDLERHQTRVSDQHRREEQQAAEVQRIRTALAHLESRAGQAQAEVDRMRRDRDRVEHVLEITTADAHRRHARFHLQQRAIDRLQRMLRRARRRRRALEILNRRYRRDLRDRDVREDQQRSALEVAESQLRIFGTRLRDQADLVERGNAALALVEDLQRQISVLEETAHRSACPPAADVEASPPPPVVVTDPHARRLAEIARHLHTRRARLRRIRRLLGRRRRTGTALESTVVQQRLRHSEVIERRQQELDEVRRILAASERRMIRRWAAPRAVLLICWAVVGTGVLAGLSWIAADHLRPAVRTASVVLAPRDTASRPFGAEDASAWQTMHRNQLSSNTFARSLTRRSATLRLEPWTTLEAVNALLRQTLIVDDSIPDRLTLTLASTDPADAAAFLDLLATSMTVSAQRSLASRPGGFVSDVLDRRREGGTVRHARIDERIVRDDRLATAGVFFGGSMLLTIMVTGLVYTRLLRVKRIFEESHPDELVPEDGIGRPI